MSRNLQKKKFIASLARLSGHILLLKFKVNKISLLSGKFPDCLETFKVLWKISRLSENFSGCLVTCQIIWKFKDCLQIFKWNRNFLSRLEIPILFWAFQDMKTFQFSWKLSRFFGSLLTWGQGPTGDILSVSLDRKFGNRKWWLTGTKLIPMRWLI